MKLTWTKTDEAPALASYALLPILRAYFKGTEVEIETADISLGGRIIANFPECLRNGQKIPDELTRLGKLAKTPEANIIKLPNISASIPQLREAITELRGKGYNIPDYIEEPSTEEERALQARFAVVLGSAVNPVLREGNSDRRAARSVKAFAQKHPHKMMKNWPQPGSTPGSVTRVAHMNDQDFYGSEKSTTVGAATSVRIEFVDSAGAVKVLKQSIPLLEGEVIDCAVMNVAALRRFYAEQMAAAKADNALLSLHLKCTMMKVSDPVMFGHCVAVYFADALEKHAGAILEVGANVNNGLADVLDKLNQLPAGKKSEFEADIAACYDKGPGLAMVDSRMGKTNLHVPNDVIVDASMPVVIRDGGKMWNKEDALEDTVAMIPDRCYATIYQVVIEDCKRHGQFDPATMGSVSNVGLMAQKAEEYGSHDKTFAAPGNGTIRIVDAGGRTLLEQSVEHGDIFRACQTKDEAIRDWVKLAVARARATGAPAVFWLDPDRGHDAQIIQKVNAYLPEQNILGLEIKIMKPVDAMKFSLERIRRGEDTISVTGNVLRDYLTDLFPIFELGTSARMLSIVPLLRGGGLFETGAGGSAPKHVQQFVKEGHLRWDSLGEYCALVPALELMATKTGNPRAALFSKTLDQAIGQYLEDAREPSRKVNEIDNRGSTYYLALAWAKALAAQDEDGEFKQRFTPVAAALAENAGKITQELLVAQGKPVDIGGYYFPDDAKCAAAMRPSVTLNAIIDGM
ncbi:MAG TPA: NADP-dependent isocitrate dehydrogenase [Bryobacteraceae bacterium]|jgi:isocitrate dehydrogenase|nr:NADP-dependent isocitrate dehydrogenase [Bryobacteraceae bacterium]